MLEALKQRNIQNTPSQRNDFAISSEHFAQLREKRRIDREKSIAEFIAKREEIKRQLDARNAEIDQRRADTKAREDAKAQKRAL